MTLAHILALQQAFPHPKTFYENIGGRTANRASGLLVTAPSQTSDHHHYHEDFNKSATPLFSNIRNNLCEKAMQSITNLGQPFLHAALKTRGVTDFLTSLMVVSSHTLDTPNSFIVMEKITLQKKNQIVVRLYYNCNQIHNTIAIWINLRRLLDAMLIYQLKHHTVGVCLKTMMSTSTINFLSMSWQKVL